MRVLHILATLGSGGAERFTVDLLNELSETDDVFLCTMYDLIPGKYDFFLKDLSPNVKIFSLGKKLGHDMSIYWKIGRLIKRIKPDVINTHISTVNYTLPSVFLFRRIKYFHTIHNEAKFEIKNRMEFYTRKFMFKSKRICPITISNDTRDSFRTLYKLDCDTLIFNGRKSVDVSPEFTSVISEIENFRTTENRKILLNIGRFAVEKNQIFLAKCIDKLINSGEEICLLIIGDYTSEEGQQIKKKIESINNRHIHILGIRSNVSDYLRLSDAFCLASTFEGLPISLIEALSFACIPICTPVGGIKEVVNSDKYGFLAKDMSPDSYESAIKNFLESKRILEIKLNLLARFDRDFNIISTAKNYRNLYHTYFKSSEAQNLKVYGKATI